MIDFTIAVPIIIALVEAAKRAGLESRWAALLAVALGLVGFGALNGVEANVLFEGLVAGLSAAGLYSGTKATVLK